jgi:hypothetical protein
VWLLVSVGVDRERLFASSDMSYPMSLLATELCFPREKELGRRRLCLH